MLACGGFRLMKFSSNKPEILKNIDSERLTPQLVDVDLQRCDIPEQKILGVIWDPGEDQLRVKISYNGYAYTHSFIHSFIHFYSRSLLNSLTQKLQILKRSRKGRSSTMSDTKTCI